MQCIYSLSHISDLKVIYILCYSYTEGKEELICNGTLCLTLGK